jgi:DNA polymerase-3 subunit delta
MASNREGRSFFQGLMGGKTVPPVCLVYGEETFLVEETVQAVINTVLPEGGDSFSHQVFHGGEVSGETVRQALESLTLFGGKRVILLRGIGAMSVGDHEAISPYFERHDPNTVLLMVGGKIDARKRFFKTISKSDCSRSIEFKPLYDNELGDWVYRRARMKGMKGMDIDLSELVAEWTGPNLAAINSALDKLCLYTEDSNFNVTEAVARTVLDDTRQRTIFELTRYLGRRDLGRSLNTFTRMLDQGQSSVGMVAMVARHFRIVWRLMEGQRKELRGRDLAKHAGCPPMFLREYEGDAKRFNVKRLQAIFLAVYEAEKALKKSRLSERLILSQLLIAVCLDKMALKA